MFKSRATVICFGIAAICGLFAIAFSMFASAQHVYSGAVPTAEGVKSLAASVCGMFGFSVVGLINFAIHRYFPAAPNLTGENLGELAELATSFRSFTQALDSKAAQRRFVFALADEVKLIPGMEVSTDGGVIILKYSGYIDESVPVKNEPAKKV